MLRSASGGELAAVRTAVRIRIELARSLDGYSKWSTSSNAAAKPSTKAPQAGGRAVAASLSLRRWEAGAGPTAAKEHSTYYLH